MPPIPTLIRKLGDSWRWVKFSCLRMPGEPTTRQIARASGFPLKKSTSSFLVYGRSFGACSGAYGAIGFGLSGPVHQGQAHKACAMTAATIPFKYLIANSGTVTFDGIAQRPIQYR